MSATVLTAHQVTWIADERRYEAEASDLPPAGTGGYIFTDYKGRDHVLVLAGCFTDREGDVIYWDYVPLNDAYFTVRVYND